MKTTLNILKMAMVIVLLSAPIETIYGGCTTSSKLEENILNGCMARPDGSGDECKFLADGPFCNNPAMTIK